MRKFFALLPLLALLMPGAAFATPCSGSGATITACGSGQFCAVDSRIPGGSSCYQTCHLASGGTGGCTGTDRCVSVTGQEVCVPADSPLVTGEGTVTLPSCATGRSCPTDHTYVCVSDQCYLANGQPCTSSGQCQSGNTCSPPATGSGGNVCTPASTSVSSGGAADSHPFTSITPQLGTPIPGLTLSPAVQNGNIINVPFLAEYVNGAYRYLIGISLIAAIVMTVYGGFRYLVGSSLGDVKSGKKIITDALGGMLIILAAYIILSTVNPATLNLSILQLQNVEYEGLDFLNDSTFEAATHVAIPTTGEMAAIVHQTAVSTGLDECGLSAVTIGESGGHANAIGYDANVPRTGIFSRRAFIRSGRKYSGATFTVPDPDAWTGAQCRPSSSSLTPAQIAAIQDRSIRNDDHFDPNNPPDYGLDTRFSVGIGAGQVTLLPSASCNPSRCENGDLGRTVNGTCYTVPQLLDPHVQLLAAADIYRRAYTGCDEYSDPYIRQRCTFAHYGGTGCSVRVGACIKMKLWATCHGVANREQADCRGYWLTKDDDYCDNYNNN